MKLEKLSLVNARYKCSPQLAFHTTRLNPALEILPYFHYYYCCYCIRIYALYAYILVIKIDSHFEIL